MFLLITFYAFENALFLFDDVVYTAGGSGRAALAAAGALRGGQEARTGPGAGGHTRAAPATRTSARAAPGPKPRSARFWSPDAPFRFLTGDDIPSIQRRYHRQRTQSHEKNTLCLPGK